SSMPTTFGLCVKMPIAPEVSLRKIFTRNLPFRQEQVSASTFLFSSSVWTWEFLYRILHCPKMPNGFSNLANRITTKDLLTLERITNRKCHDRFCLHLISVSGILFRFIFLFSCRQATKVF